LTFGFAKVEADFMCVGKWDASRLYNKIKLGRGS
jgi:hypothetical protein